VNEYNLKKMNLKGSEEDERPIILDSGYNCYYNCFKAFGDFLVDNGMASNVPVIKQREKLH
jgi:hypothetical protein